ncbi:MAG: electron transfer flavoprotein subunit beta/FixA family protein [marine benthic group bacterium]|nr:electron transfer flavoprotein subunit beta/FixA family protein [Gemmatimonadota bacterium]
MNSIVCIKRVPDSETRVRIASDGLAVDRSGVKFDMNEYDKYALEEAIRRKEEAGEGLVTVLTVGGDDARETLRQALAMGADEAVLLRAETGFDGLPVAVALAEEIRDRPFDLLLFGKQAIDDDGMQVPAMVAELLGLPAATVVVSLEIEAGRAVARREVEGGHETVEFDLPGIVAAQKGLSEPRYPSLKGIMAAKKKPLEEKDVTLVEGGLELLELSGPPDRPEPQILGEGAEAVPELVRRLREEVKVL